MTKITFSPLVPTGKSQGKSSGRIASSAVSMAELMAKHKTTLKTFFKGDMIEGTITKLTRGEILVDIDAKTEAVVLEKDKPLLRIIMTTLKAGDKVTVQILNPESDTGNPIVSLRRFLDGRAWAELEEIQKKGGKIEIFVRNMTKGGYLAETPQGIDAFLPNSHTAEKGDLTGKRLSVMVAELIRETRKLIVSQKHILGQKDFDDLVKSLKNGQIVDAIVSHITTFGMFVNIPIKSKEEEVFLDGFIHISEVSWVKVNDLNDAYKIGQIIQAVVLKLDTKTKRIDLSIKKLTEDPFTKLAKDFPLDKKFRVTILQISEQGVTVDLGVKKIEGFIRKDKIPVGTTYKEGQKVECTVSEIDQRKRRVILAPVLLDKPLMYR